MDLRTYFQSGQESLSALARRIEVPPALVSQWHTGVRQVPIERAVQIEMATDGVVTRRDLRPDDWHVIWPELCSRQKRTQAKRSRMGDA